MTKAIETSYKGYRFRSRLEARWAVFLDSLNIKYIYETEGYDLDGIWYLPDFWSNDLSGFIEIKPGNPSDAEWDKAVRLSCYKDATVYVFCGDSLFHDEIVIYRITSMGPPPLFIRHCTPPYFWESVQWAKCRYCGWFGLAPDYECCLGCNRSSEDGYKQLLIRDTFLTAEHYRYARSARFEYGHTP
jgi:hypothetical protein